MKTIILLFTLLYLANSENSAIEEFTKANNLFTQSIYEQISKTESGNFLVSPFSAETILALTQAGCKGKSNEELISALHLPNDQNKIETAVKEVLPELKKDTYTLHSVNKIYIKNNFQFKEKFKSTAEKVYQANIETIDFEKQVKAASTMNKWVEDNTKNKIKNLVDPNILNKYSRAVLINALYFKANWSSPFLLSSTKTKPFHKTETKTVNVDTLHHYEENFKYYECPHLKAKFLELPFNGNEATMTIVLPNEISGLSRLEKNLDQVFSPQHQLQETFLNIALPKFKIESSIDFKDILSKLGVKEIFDKEKADLSGIAGEKGDLYVNKITQKSCIDVNEEGVEAAAATFVLVAVPESARLERPKDFIADHPFIFYIKIKNLIVFAGKVTDPS